MEDALNAYRGGNLDDALHKLNDARNSVDQFTESGQITSRTFATQLQSGLDAVAAQMEATPPPPGEGHGHGEGKGGGQGGGNGDNQD